MGKLFDEMEDNYSFTWESIGDINEGRSNLGDNMPVFVYRLFQYTMRDVLCKKFGKNETKEIFKQSGKLAGEEFAKHALDLSLPFEEFAATLKEILEESRIGVLRIEEFDTSSGHAILTIGEDLDCSGLPMTGETVCDYDEGFLEGILNSYTKKNYFVKEVDCWATGARVCRFDAVVKE